MSCNLISCKDANSEAVGKGQKYCSPIKDLWLDSKDGQDNYQNVDFPMHKVEQCFFKVLMLGKHQEPLSGRLESARGLRTWSGTGMLMSCYLLLG